MKGVIEKSEDYISKQRERMGKLLQDKITDKKYEELSMKLNILGSFRFPKKPTQEEL